MRWFVVVALLVLASPGRLEARRIVVSDPPIVMACPGDRTWDRVAACLNRQGKTTIVKTLLKAKLVRVVQTENGKEYDQGVYLYVEGKNGFWTIGGMFDGSSYSVMDIVPLTLDGHTGYRLDIGQIFRTTMSLDDRTTVPVTMSTHRVLFCSGERYGCPDATRSCEVMYRGKTVWTFRGSLVFEKGIVKVAGDRRFGGNACVPNGQVFLNWPAQI